MRTFAGCVSTTTRSSPAQHQRYSLVLHVADLTDQVPVGPPWDYWLYGLDADPSADRRRGAGIHADPLFLALRPVRVETDHGAATWVDGGLLANYPITVLDRTDGGPARRRHRRPGGLS